MVNTYLWRKLALACTTLLFTIGTYADNYMLNILDLGACNDGSVDISDIVNANTERGTIYLPAGIYRVDKPLKLKNPLHGDGYMRNNVVTPAATWLISHIECADGTMGVVEYADQSGINVDNLNIQCHSREDGIRIKPCRQHTLTMISRVGIFNVEGCGVRVEGSGSRPVFLEDMTIFGNGNCPMGCTAIIIDPADCRLTNIEAMGVQVGLDIRGGYTYGCNLHLWTGYLGRRDDGEWWKGTRGIVLQHGGIFVGSQIYPDTSYYLFEQKGSNRGGFDITEFIYYDDNTERDSRYLDGQLFHAEEGSTPNLRIHGGMMAVCGSDEHPCGMTRMYTPGQDIDNVLVRTDRKICGSNIDILCLGDALPDYTVAYPTPQPEGSKVADIFNVSPSGTVRARLSTDTGALWLLDITKRDGQWKAKARAQNPTCKGYKLRYVEEDGLIKVYLVSPDNSPLKARFTTEAMAPYFRPVDYASLRRHDFSTRYAE